RRMQRAHVFDRASAKHVAIFISSIYLQGLALLSSRQAKDTAAFGYDAVNALERFCAANGVDQKRFAVEYARQISSDAIRVVGAETQEQVIENSRLESDARLDARLFHEWDNTWPDDIEELVNPSLWPKLSKVN